MRPDDMTYTCTPPTYTKTVGEVYGPALAKRLEWKDHTIAGCRAVGFRPPKKGELYLSNGVYGMGKLPTAEYVSTCVEDFAATEPRLILWKKVSLQLKRPAKPKRWDVEYLWVLSNGRYDLRELGDIEDDIDIILDGPFEIVEVR